MYYQYQQEINDRVRDSLKTVSKPKGSQLQDTPEPSFFAYRLIRKWISTFPYPNLR